MTLTPPSGPIGGLARLRANLTLPAGLSASVRFEVVGQFETTDSSSPFEVDIPTDQFRPLQTLTVRATATDSLGLTGPTVTTTYTVADPMAHLDSPPDQLFVAPKSVPWSASTLALAGRTVDRVELWVDGHKVATDTTKPYGGTVDLSPYVAPAPGVAEPVVLVALVVDSAGLSASQGRTVYVRPPTFRPLHLGGAQVPVGEATRLRADVERTPGVPIDRVEFLANNTLVGSDTTAPYAVDWTPQALGTKQVTVRAVDKTGYVYAGPGDSLEVVDGGGASIDIVTPTEGATPGFPVPVAWTIEVPDGSTLINVEAYLDGVSNGVLGTSSPATFEPSEAFGVHDLRLDAWIDDGTNQYAVSSPNRAIRLGGALETVTISGVAEGATIRQTVQLGDLDDPPREPDLSGPVLQRRTAHRRIHHGPLHHRLGHSHAGRRPRSADRARRDRVRCAVHDVVGPDRDQEEPVRLVHLAVAEHRRRWDRPDPIERPLRSRLHDPQRGLPDRRRHRQTRHDRPVRVRLGLDDRRRWRPYLRGDVLDRRRPDRVDHELPVHRGQRPMSPTPADIRVAFLGLGTMGSAMAANLARAGFPLVVWNRTPGRAAELAELGVETADHPADAAARADVIVVCVSDTPDVEAVLFGTDGVAEGARGGSLIIDCSTIAPSGSWEFAARLRERGLAMVDAPVSGGSEGARNATLTIFVGGDEADVERARPVLSALGRTITHVGPIGAGQAVKAVNQVILAGTYLGVAEGIVLALKAGLDVEQVVGALGGGAAQSWVLANRSGRMIDNDYPLGFKVALHRKDLGIALELANQLGASLPVSALAAQLESGLIARGHADDDMSALARAIRGLSGLDD